MATKPTKKRKTSSSSKRKPTRKKRQNKSTFKRTILISLLSFTLLLFIGLAYYFTIYNNEKFHVKSEKKGHYGTKEMLNDLAKIKVQKPQIPIKPKEISKEKKFEMHITDAKKAAPFKERGEIKKKEPIAKKDLTLAYRGKKPRLVIIIDDVHTKAQIQAIKNLGLKITPSIFPPYALAKHSNKLAKQVKHFMIHLPMESGNRQLNKQTKTLMTSFSDEQIADRVMEIRALFPRAKYINNHTGSVFTSNYSAMKKLYIALKMEGFTFVDSFTEATSKVRQIVHEFGDAYVRRDIFIDNTHNVNYIHKQLAIAVKKAKKNGYAIAIGHPHKVTMQALASAKPILKEVELVYIDDIYRKKK